MACKGWYGSDSDQSMRSLKTAFPTCSRARRPVLNPTTKTLSLAETANRVQAESSFPLLSSPNPAYFQNVRSASPPASETPLLNRTLRGPSPKMNQDHQLDTLIIPPALARNPRRCKAWLKARCQHARNRVARTPPPGQILDSAQNQCRTPKSNFSDIGPKRKHTAFVQEAEFKSLMEAQAGTLHISELQADEDVSAQLALEELRVGGEIAGSDMVDQLGCN